MEVAACALCLCSTFNISLSDAGSDVSAGNVQFWTPLHLAIEAGHSEVVGVLLEAGARLDIVTTDGYSVSSLAECRADEKVLQLLAQKKLEELSVSDDGTRDKSEDVIKNCDGASSSRL